MPLPLKKFIGCLLITWSVVCVAEEYSVPEDSTDLAFYERVNLGINPLYVREKFKEGRLEVATTNESSATQFILSTLKPHDKVLLNHQETMYLDIIVDSNLSENQTLIPTIVIRDEDKAKIFGLISRETLGKIILIPKRESSFEDIVNHPVSDKLTVVYGLCPKDRVGTCDFTIKHKGTWILDEDQKNIKTFKGVARAVFNEDNDSHPHRVSNESSTPQGIYGLWATMYCSHPSFGREPRIDLDVNAQPINGFRYDTFSFLLENLVPTTTLDEYWINELPLAFAMGRSLFRVHTNSLNFEKKPENKYQSTAGCINLGDDMGIFYQTLCSLDVFDKNYTELQNNQQHIPIQWDQGKKYGKAFLIIKDY